MQEMWEIWTWSLGQKDPLEEKVANHSSILAWIIPWTEEPGSPWCHKKSGTIEYKYNVCVCMPIMNSLSIHLWLDTYVTSISWLLTTAVNISEWSEVIQSCPTLCNPMGCSLPGSSVHGIFQARILEWVAISFCRESSWSRGRTWVSHIVGRRFTIWATRQAHRNTYIFSNSWIIW